MPLRDITLYSRPLLSFSRSTGERFFMVGICSGLAIAQSAITDNGATLIIVLSTLAAALLTEAGINFLKKKPGIHDLSATVTALTLTLILPNTINPAAAAMAAVFAIAVVKESFGGIGANWLNPALGGWLFLRFSWPELYSASFDGSAISFITSQLSDGMGSSNINPVALLNRNGFGTQNGDVITTFLNNSVFSWIHAELPASYLDFFIDPGPGIIADRGVFGLLLGSMIIIASHASRFFLSAVYLVVFAVVTLFVGAFLMGGIQGSNDIIFCFFSGATLVAAFLLVVEPVTSAKSIIGRLLLVISAALLTFFFRFIKADACGAMIAIACLNSVTPLLRKFEEQLYYERSISGGLTQ